MIHRKLLVAASLLLLASPALAQQAADPKMQQAIADWNAVASSMEVTRTTMQHFQEELSGLMKELNALKAAAAAKSTPPGHPK